MLIDRRATVARGRPSRVCLFTCSHLLLPNFTGCRPPFLWFPGGTADVLLWPFSGTTDPLPVFFIDQAGNKYNLGGGAIPRILGSFEGLFQQRSTPDNPDRDGSRVVHSPAPVYPRQVIPFIQNNFNKDKTLCLCLGEATQVRTGELSCLNHFASFYGITEELLGESGGLFL